MSLESARAKNKDVRPRATERLHQQSTQPGLGNSRTRRCLLVRAVAADEHSRGPWVIADKARRRTSKCTIMTSQKRLPDPANVPELIRFWLLHAHKGRDRHDTAARRFEGRRLWYGVLTIALTAIVGSSVFASIGQQPAVWIRVLVGLLSVTASTFAALQTFLDYQGRSERHRIAAAKYKATIRELEEVLSTPDDRITVEQQWFGALRQRFDALEQEMPVVAPRIYDEIERIYTNATFVDNATALYRRAP